jgi:octaprenyl-diphosphate synthase
MGSGFAAAPDEKNKASTPQPLWLTEHHPNLKSLLQEVEGRIAALARSEVELLDEAGQYVVSGRGKRLRPALLLLSAEACGGVNPLALETAAVVELIHTASLVHDDVLDEASARRGKASARALWGNKVSVLLGDYLLCRAVCRLEEIAADSMVDKLLITTQQMCEGQISEITETGGGLNEARYLKIITQKTASLMGFCCWLGACAVGLKFGTAFQIADDIHDLIGSQESSGKPVNNDLRQKKVTLPLIFSLRRAEEEERAFLQSALSQETLSEGQLGEMRRIAIACGGVDYAWSVCRKYLEEARGALLSLAEARPTHGGQAYQALLLSCGEAFPLPVMA